MTREAEAFLLSLKLCAFRLSLVAIRFSPHVAAGLAPVVGALAYRLVPRERRAVRRNVRVVRPNATSMEVDWISRSVFHSVARYYVDLLRLPNRGVRALHDRLEVHGYEHFLAAQAEGRGVIVASLHLGPAEIVLQAFAARGVRYTAMVERIEPPRLAALLRRVRQAHGHRYVYPDLSGARELLRTLRAGGTVALLVDRDVIGSGIEASFCGRTLRVPAGPIELAGATKAPIIPSISAWLPDGRYLVRLMPAMHTDFRGRDPARKRAEVERLLARLEPCARESPEQWLVLMDLWA
ncbi:MAG: lysophospholipid acyltransferase family protein [Dehalococcoidia bacterium]